ncbi:hypothetical protein AB205_0033610, partial [Aquarana catesbeiana]
YGLFFPKKLQQKNTFAPKHSAFADDSDDEQEIKTAEVIKYHQKKALFVGTVKHDRAIVI